DISTHYECDWKIPYLHVDPATLGRKFEKFIRINSQSGKGGTRYVMEVEYGIKMPPELLKNFQAEVQALADSKEAELVSEELWDLFRQNYIDCPGPIVLKKYLPRPDEKNPESIHGEVHLLYDGKSEVLSATGNGPISAFTEALRPRVPFVFHLQDFKEISLNKGADAEALAYVAITGPGDKVTCGVGLGTNIDQAAVKAIVSAVNKQCTRQEKTGN
ncbi:MAG: hypothetical protein HQL31_06620, partial [Planctomycetes bacterium]|nr:hypothetical protein [Planctomycetota bacterium]